LRNSNQSPADFDAAKKRVHGFGQAVSLPTRELVLAGSFDPLLDRGVSARRLEALGVKYRTSIQFFSLDTPAITSGGCASYVLNRPHETLKFTPMQPAILAVFFAPIDAVRQNTE
jgi:hypothetical protein